MDFPQKNAWSAASGWCVEHRNPPRILCVKSFIIDCAQNLLSTLYVRTPRRWNCSQYTSTVPPHDKLGGVVPKLHLEGQCMENRMIDEILRDEKARGDRRIYQERKNHKCEKRLPANHFIRSVITVKLKG